MSIELKDSINNPNDIRVPFLNKEIAQYQELSKTYILAYNLALDKQKNKENLQHCMDLI